MEQRREPRFEADQAVAVTLLGETELKHSARVKNASGRGLALEMCSPVAPGTALKIEFDDAVVLGEAVYCRGAKGQHLVGVELDQMLCGLTELGRKLQEFTGEPLTGDGANGAAGRFKEGDRSGRQVAHTLDDRNGQN
jgi:PilZ domain